MPQRARREEHSTAERDRVARRRLQRAFPDVAFTARELLASDASLGSGRMLLSWVDGPTADTVLEAVAHGLPTPDRIEIRRSFLFERAMPVALERLAQDISCSSDAVARRLEATALDSSAADGRFARRTALLRGAGDAGNWELGQPLVLAEAAAVTYDIATLFAPYGNEILEVYLALVGDLGSWIPGRADRRLLDLATLALGEGVAGRRGASRAGGGRAGRKMTPDPVGARRRRPESA